MISNRKDLEATKDQMRKKRTLSASSSSLFFIFLCCSLSLAIAFSTFRIFGVSFKPVLISTWQSSAMNSLYPELPFPLQTQHAISFPDLLLFVITNPQLNANSKLQCRYHPQSSSNSTIKLPPISSSTDDANTLFVRCPKPPNNSSVSLLPSSPIHPLSWDRLAYTSILDTQDNTTIVFAKGFNLRPARLSDPTRYECLFGWHFKRTKYTLTTPAVSAAQEIFRCKTPLSVLRRSALNPPLVTVKTKYITLPSVARPQIIPFPKKTKEYEMCVCTMVRNQARFLREWITYHTRIGVQRWFVYDNNSDDDIEEVARTLNATTTVTIHEWPWIKTQEAGFAHCALRARGSCEWIGFIDVDEFVYLPSDVRLSDVLRNYSRKSWVGELRSECRTFGPSRRKKVPLRGVMVGYTCRMVAPERHKSIVKAEALNPSLINIVHHFHLKEGMRYVNVESRVMVINHYKYQVWEVFKEKFYRRVATYVADWKDEENVGSKDRAPGLGTKAVQPHDWSTRFCEVNDSRLKKFVLREFIDRETGLLPW